MITLILRRVALAVKRPGPNSETGTASRRDCGQRRGERPAQALEGAKGPREPDRDGFRVRDRAELRDQLPKVMWDRGDDEERESHRDGRRDRVREAPEDGSSSFAIDGSPRNPIPIEQRVIPTCRRRCTRSSR